MPGFLSHSFLNMKHDKSWFESQSQSVCCTYRRPTMVYSVDGVDCGYSLNKSRSYNRKGEKREEYRGKTGDKGDYKNIWGTFSIYGLVSMVSLE